MILIRLLLGILAVTIALVSQPNLLGIETVEHVKSQWISVTHTVPETPTYYFVDGVLSPTFLNKTVQLKIVTELGN